MAMLEYILKIELSYSYQERWRDRAQWNPATCIYKVPIPVDVILQDKKRIFKVILFLSKSFLFV